MYATPFEILLANLRSNLPLASERISQDEAYQRLKKLTGKDFGYDSLLWEEWGFDNEMFATPPRFLFYLRNIKGEVPERSPYYMPKKDAYRYLQEWSQMDFGDDIEQWERWGKSNGYLRDSGPQ